MLDLWWQDSCRQSCCKSVQHEGAALERCRVGIGRSSGGGSAPLGGHLVSSSHIKKGHKANSVSWQSSCLTLKHRQRFVGVETFRVQLLCYKKTINLSKKSWRKLAQAFENKSDMRTCPIGNLNIHQSVHCWRCWDLFPDRDKLVTEKSESSLWSSCWQWSTYLSSKKVTSWLWQIRGDCGFFLPTTSTVTLAGSRVWPSQLPQSSHLGTSYQICPAELLCGQVTRIFPSQTSFF